jgi:hypothetical protein
MENNKQNQAKDMPILWKLTARVSGLWAAQLS